MEKTKTFLKFIYVSFFCNLVYPSDYINLLGTSGYYLTPSAKFMEEGSLGFNFGKNYAFSKANFVAQPYENIEVSIFYSDIPNKAYPLSLGQSYKDKGFNIKFKVLEEGKVNPAIAIGMSDIAGSGIFSGEFIVATKKINNFELSAGLGWGIYAKNANFSNPLSNLSKRFESRAKEVNETGKFDVDNYFSGKNVGLFSALSYTTKNGLIILEYSSFESGEKFGIEEELGNLNIGYVLRNNLFKPGIFFDSNNNINFNISSSFNFSTIQNRKYQNLEKTNNPSVDLVRNLQNNGIALKSISFDEYNNLIIGIRQNTYSDQQRSVLNTIKSIEEAGFKGTEEIVVKNYYFGEEITEDFYNISNQSVTKKAISTKAVKQIYGMEEERLYQSFNIKPAIQTFLASREEFLKYALVLNLDYKLFFSENFFIDSHVKYSIYDNFNELFLEPITTFPNQVRSDVKDYLNSLSDGPVIEVLDLNYYKKSGNNYFSFKAGIIERMFAGYGMEYLWLSRFNNYAIGFEIFDVQKRDYNQRFDLLDYGNITGHINFYRYIKDFDMTIHVSTGEYLAGDKGYTLDFSKRFKNGLEMGAFYTITDVSFEDFGEGSFDKGIYVSVPFSLFQGTANTSFRWTPLTKDPGQKLNYKFRIFDQIDRYVY